MQKRNFKKGIYYHIYNRGCNKQRLFFCDQDLIRFGDTIKRYLLKFPTIKIYVWCFLPNHFHFLLSEDISSSNLEAGEASQISKFMQKIQQSYAMYFNRKYGDSVKKGQKAPIFEGRFNSKEIISENYLQKVAYYIRYNALKHEIVENVEEWVWAGGTSTNEFPIIEAIGLDPEFDPGFE